MKAHPTNSHGADHADDHADFAKGFVYRGTEIKPYYITRLAETRAVYEAMKKAAAVSGCDEG